VSMELFEFSGGSAPLLVSMPHSGTYVPPDIEARFVGDALLRADTDWHIPRLYNFLAETGASVITATHSRYVIDLNRPPDGKPLYPGADNTELCPATSFAGHSLYLDGQAPTDEEVAERRESYWWPYHQAIEAELAAIKARHGIALLWDAHSIRSQVPRFFKGRLPDFNFGSAGGESADDGLVSLLAAVAKEAEGLGYSYVVNGRFKGGYITRRYGCPESGVNAVQLELSQITYMEEDLPYAFDEKRASRVREVIAGLVQTMIAWGELEAPD